MDFFENKIRPVLVQRCYECHSVKAKRLKGSLLLDTYDGLMRGGESGQEIIPGDPDSSRLIRAIRYVDKDLQMPPKNRLTPEQVADFETWVRMGAPYPRELPSGSGRNSSGNDRSTFWSFQPIQRPSPPEVKSKGRVQNPIDQFILAKLEQKGLTPAPVADKRTLIRRVYFDLSGLPPAPERVESFLADESPQAYEKLIDELLASKKYGERWARHWLDVVRYADSGGYETDIYYRNAWRYRDYVIKSFNDGKPYDRFVQEQIAGDELWPDDLALDGSYDVPKEKLKHLEARIGTGLYTLGTQVHESNMDAPKREYEWLTDCADTTAAVFMGLTMGCARCHDHKFDPITQRDYFALQAIFAGSKEVEIATITGMGIADYKQSYPRILKVEEERKAYRLFEQRTKDRPLTGSEKEEKQRLLENIAQAVLSLPEGTAHDGPFVGLMEIPTATVLGHERPELVEDIKILNRGDLKRPREKVSADIPVVLRRASGWTEQLPGPFGSRKQLALWLTDPNHPLTSRVMVNRIWQWHFGGGLVSTANDFGKMGQPPSHPELLDWLANKFIAEGWSLKKMHRLIMLSRTYQMTSRFVDEKNSLLDPDNRLLWRMNRRRLEAEELWDSLHATAGTLNLKMGGRPVVPPLVDDEIAALRESWHWPVAANPEEHNRRGIYLLVRRNFRFPMFDVFDSPVNSVSAASRDVTTVAPQALWFLNNNTAYHQAQELAARLITEDSAGWNKPDFGAGQTGWQGQKAGGHAGWAKRIESGQRLPGFDVPAGTVITHGPTSVLWKAPADEPGGVLNMAGSLWNIRHSGRTGAWKLWQNDKTLLTEGQIDDAAGNSAKPFGLASGIGGGKALKGIAYTAGDTFRLEILEDDFVAVNLTVQAKRTNDLAADFSLESNPTSTAWQYSESLEHSGGIVGAAIKHTETVLNPDRWVEKAWRILFARPPSAQEKQGAIQLFEVLSHVSAEPKLPPDCPSVLTRLPQQQGVALAQLCLALFNLNEFMYID